ncbi:hypothetical protein EMCRGX_G016142 [Ephydatia muelleri]
MVKILSNFHDVEKQTLLSPKGEPHAVHCSSGCLFMALDNCLVEVYQAETVQLIAQVRTVGPVLKLIYDSPWNCIVTLERKHAERHNFVRVYFNWRSATLERPVRVGHLDSPHNSDTASSPSSASTEIVELPTEDDRSVTCLASCERTGVIAVGTAGLVRLFAIRKPVDRAGARVISTLCDISLEMDVVKVAVFCGYVACISSSCEVRVLKVCWYDGRDEYYGLKTYPPSSHSHQPPPRHHHDDRRHRCPSGSKAPPLTTPDISLDASFIEWSPRCARDARGNVSLTTELRPSPPTSGTPTSGTRASVGSLHLHSISKATEEQEGTGYQTEVLGPVETGMVGGQRVEVEAGSVESGEHGTCHVITMLYRRFVPKTEGLNFSSSDPKSRSGTLADASGGGRRAGDKSKGATLPPTMGEQKSKGASPQPENMSDAPHTVELLPTLVEGPSGTVLVGLSCFVASQHQGYIYDIHRKTRRVSTFSFNSNTLAASCGSGLLYTLSEDSLDAYTSRVFPSCLAQSPPCSRCVDSEDVGGGGDELAPLWLCQPCPASSMDMTLISTNKFIGAHSMACCKDYVVVLTKEVTDSTTSQENAYASNWFLQSLPLRRPTKPQPREASWNVYILKMKPHEAMYQQFLEFATTLKDSSPPMHQHLLKEGHLLLRSELLHSWPPPAAKVKVLRQNCLELATSLCTYPTMDRETPTSAIAEYFIMSGCPIAQVIELITSLAMQSKTGHEQENVLYTYLEMVLFERGNASREGQALASSGNRILDFYADNKPHRLPYLLLHSWYQDYDKEKALAVLEGCLKVSSIESSPLISLCQAYLCLQLQRHPDAVRKLNQVPKDFLTQWMKQHAEFIVDREKMETTPLGKVIGKNQGSCFMEFVAHSAIEGQLGFEQLCTVLKLHTTMAENTVLKQFLEKVILGHIPALTRDSVCTQKAVLLLTELLVSRTLIEDMAAPPGPTVSSTTTFSSVMFGVRHKWLDSIIPTDSCYSTPDSKELESLLCSCHVNPEVARCVNRLLDGTGKEAIETLQLRLLTWPHMGKLEEATKLVLAVCPSVAVDFCLTYFGPELTHWKWLLGVLLGDIQQATPPKATMYSSLLRRSLDYVVTITTVEEFVGLLPQNGSLAFFLPLLEHSCKLFMSRQIARQLQCDLIAAKP